MFSLYSTIIGFFSLFSLVSATGHLRLDLISSDSMDVNMQTNSSSQTIFLDMGTRRIVSFHPKIDQEYLEVTFSQRDGRSVSLAFQLNNSGLNEQKTMIFLNIVLMVQSVFECDPGFIGETCQEKSITSTSTITTTTTTTTSTTTATTKTTTTATEGTTSSSKKSATSTTTTITEKTKTSEVAQEVTTVKSLTSNISINNIIWIALIITIVVLLMLIVIIYLALRTRQPQMQVEAPSKKYQDDSGIDSPGSRRYTTSPHFNVRHQS